MLFMPLKPRLREGPPLDLIWLALGSPALAECAVQEAPGALVIDLQHGLWDRSSLEAAVGVARRFIPVLVRTADHSAHSIAQALDAGASSVLVPMVNTEEEARLAVAASRYPPVGQRSAGGFRPLLAGLDAMVEADRQVAVGVMIETAQGVENAAAIAAVPGVDYLFLGTGDLSLARGTRDPAVLERDCERVLQAAQARGLPCGIFTADALTARKRLANGYRMAVSSNDIDVVRRGFALGRDQAFGADRTPVRRSPPDRIATGEV